MKERREVFGAADEAVVLLDWTRRRANLTSSALAKRMGVDQSTVQEYRNGRRPRPGWAWMVRWLHACGFRVILEREIDG